MIGVATPTEIAALWRLGFLTGEDIAAVCMRWLEEDIDGADLDVAALAGEAGLTLASATLPFERALRAMVPRQPDRDEAILRALRLHLAWALASDDLSARIGLTLTRFAHLEVGRLVRHPSRTDHRPDATFAAQDLGLEFLYGAYHQLDELDHICTPAERPAAKAQLLVALQEDATILKAHLSTLLAD